MLSCLWCLRDMRRESLPKEFGSESVESNSNFQTSWNDLLIIEINYKLERLSRLVSDILNEQKKKGKMKQERPWK